MSDCRHVFTTSMGPDCTGRASIWKCDDCGRLGVTVYPPPPGAVDLAAQLVELREALRVLVREVAGPGYDAAAHLKAIEDARALLARHADAQVKR